jgi:hypothetical protein
LYAATFSGVFHNDGSGWVVMPDSPDEMMRLFILPTGELFAADYHRVFRHNAQGWTLIRNTEDDSDPDIMGSLWAFGANDVLTGSEDNLRRFDGVSWKRIDNVGSFDLLAFSPDNIYSLGPDQLRHSSGGGAFEPVGPFFNATRVTGTSPDHIVVTGRDAYAAYYQGQWVVGTEPKVFNVDLVPAVDGSIVRLDVFAPSRFGIWYHRE